jgi:1-acyl-sn-glycerol-3-phosphate acyltransferase
MRSWLARRWYDLLYIPSFILLVFVWSVRIRGRRNWPQGGPLLVVSNHQSFIDPVLVGLTAPGFYFTYLARQSLFRHRWLRWLIRSLGAIPIDNKGLGRAGLQATLEALQNGAIVLVFPEGERTHDGYIQPFEAGVSLLIRRVHAPIVPVGVAGVYEAWSRHMKLPRPAPLFLPPRRGAVAVVIGKSIDPASLTGLSREEMLSKLHQAVAVCAEEAERFRRKTKPAGTSI